MKRYQKRVLNGDCRNEIYEIHFVCKFAELLASLVNKFLQITPFKKSLRELR